MQFREDESAFDQLQLRLVNGLLKTIRSTLEEAGVEPQQLPQLTTELGYSIASILDGSESLDSDDSAEQPFVAFAMDDDGEDIVYSEGGSWMHEYVHSFATDLFGDGAETEDDEEDDIEDEELG